MIEHMPLVGPPTRRGWREIVRFAPLTSSAHAALVVTRRGRLVDVVPANSPRFLSDYLGWPCELREVDTRERPLELEQRIESRDAGHAFDVLLRLVYQVSRPDLVALALEDPIAALERMARQSVRQLDRSFGVEQARGLAQNLGELIGSGDVARRAQSLGLALRRVEVDAALDERARAFAEELSFHARERPFHFQLKVDSRDADGGFDVQVGGFYRLIDRAPAGTLDALDAKIKPAVGRALRRIGMGFAASDYAAAGQAMADALRKDPLLEAELSSAQVQLLRPTAQILPDRGLLQAVPVVQPIPSAAPPDRLAAVDVQPSEKPRESFGAPPADEAPTLLAMREGARPPAPAEPPASELPAWIQPAPAESPAWMEPAPESYEPASAEYGASPEGEPADRPTDAPLDRLSSAAGAEQSALADPTEPIAQNELLVEQAAREQRVEIGSPDTAPVLPVDSAEPEWDQAIPDWLVAPQAGAPAPAEMEAPDRGYAAPEQGKADAASSPPAELAGQGMAADWGDTSVVAAPETGIGAPVAAAYASAPGTAAAPGQVVEGTFDEPVASFIALLHTHGPAHFKMWALELREQPERLPEVLAELTIDGWMLNQAEERRHQEALARALAESPSRLAALAARPAAASPPAPEPPAEEPDMPDWMWLRQKWSEDGGNT